MRDVHATMRTVAALREAGLAIALDDFGTGYSSLAHLKRLPIDVVKIDRTFTAGVPDDPHDAAIVEAVLGIATRYGFATIAEGVETPRQAAYLLAAGCFHAQGLRVRAAAARRRVRRVSARRAKLVARSAVHTGMKTRPHRPPNRERPVRTLAAAHRRRRTPFGGWGPRVPGI